MASIYTVGQVTAYIKNMFAQDFALKQIQLKGEVSNCKHHTSGHIYFTMKDAKASIPCVMFADARKTMDFVLKDGMKIVAEGGVSVYERDGRYQFYVKSITVEGAGDLFARFQKLKEELSEMGMFAAEYKKPIPKYCTRVGIVTAPTGAAIQDICQIASRRNPYVQLFLYPALVQGISAAASIVHALERLDTMGLDCIIVGRGGGSIEDLWAFNEESVARAIFSCQTPVISAVGHETDFTIADFVADMRAPTPSAAAELAVFDYRQFEAQLEYVKERLQGLLQTQIQSYKSKNEQALLRLKALHPRSKLKQDGQALAALKQQLYTQIQQALVRDKNRLAVLSERLNGVSPLKRLGNGYAHITDNEGKPVETTKSLTVGETLHIRFKDGCAKADITQLIIEGNHG